MRRGTAVLLVVALLAATVALVVAQARTWPGPPTDTNPRANTPNDHDFDYAEPDDEDGDYMPNAASVFDEDHRLFGFAPNDTKTTALYVTLMLSDDDGTIFGATIPAGQFVANSRGTRLLYHVRTPGLSRVRSRPIAAAAFASGPAAAAST